LQVPWLGEASLHHRHQRWGDEETAVEWNRGVEEPARRAKGRELECRQREGLEAGTEGGNGQPNLPGLEGRATTEERRPPKPHSARQPTQSAEPMGFDREENPGLALETTGRKRKAAEECRGESRPPGWSRSKQNWGP
jgi:hypothetical protein